VAGSDRDEDGSTELGKKKRLEMRKRVMKITPNKIQGYRPTQSRHVVLPRTVQPHPQPHFELPSKPIIPLQIVNPPVNYSILIIFHLYYADLAQDFLDRLLKLKGSINFDLIVTSPKYSTAHKSDILQKYTSQLNAKIITVENLGKDIIPKLIAVESTIKAKKQYDYVFMMHDKKSPQYKRAASMNKWKEDLVHVLFDNTKRNFVFHLLSEDQNIGAIGTAKHLHYGPGWHKELPTQRHRNELALLNHQLNFKNMLNVSSLHPSWFIGGTMFWIRWDILANFYDKYGFDRIFSLAKDDTGDVRDPSFTHYLERLFGQMVSMAGMKTIGI